MLVAVWKGMWDIIHIQEGKMISTTIVKLSENIKPANH